jgi:hypothetical protein
MVHTKYSCTTFGIFQCAGLVGLAFFMVPQYHDNDIVYGLEAKLVGNANIYDLCFLMIYSIQLLCCFLIIYI